jgi:hypothetical protein
MSIMTTFPERYRQEVFSGFWQWDKHLYVFVKFKKNIFIKKKHINSKF